MSTYNIDPSKPVWQLSCGELVALVQKAVAACSQGVTAQQPPVPSERGKYVYGLQGLAELIGSSTRTAGRLIKSRTIAPAVTRTGRKIIVDADMALELLRMAQKRRKRYS